jgi:hypothetical protein
VPPPSLTPSTPGSETGGSNPRTARPQNGPRPTDCNGGVTAGTGGTTTGGTPRIANDPNLPSTGGQGC